VNKMPPMMRTATPRIKLMPPILQPSLAKGLVRRSPSPAPSGRIRMKCRPEQNRSRQPVAETDGLHQPPPGNTSAPSSFNVESGATRVEPGPRCCEELQAVVESAPFVRG
jgi:hypothetical protein